MSLKVIGTNMYRSATYDFLLTFHNNHGLLSHRFRDKTAISVNLSHPMYFTPLLTGLPLELGIGTRGQKLELWGYQFVKKVLR